MISGSTRTPPKLFQPVQVGNLTLKHHIVLAPLTRFRADDTHVHGKLAVEYYAQRASMPGTLLITEGTFIAAKAGGMPNVPGIWNDEQIAAWKEVVHAVHARGCYIYLQLWALGRRAKPQVLAKEGIHDSYVSSSSIPEPGATASPRSLTISEIKEYVQLYATAAFNAVHKAGFDGVEIHGAGGYLPDQFLQDVCNQREDEYGGSLENRCRFSLEVVKAVADAVGEAKTGFRISPWGRFGGMREKDPKATFSYFLRRLRDLHPSLAYLHMIEPRTDGPMTVKDMPEGDSNDFVREIWAPRPIVSAGGYTKESALEAAEKYGYLVAFGRYFIANPDLPQRILQDIPWTRYDRKTFYIPKTPRGYIDYPFAKL
ncbi:FMN-linked oxidoreductase [Gloeophyllum trabeum ATCC 11539]|uniref:FMN-linked oxidoreductase n=1 Tax=Gloeophyllum trabeum (strain ATCC 11539 / FP-39264 / Madison 617) TaxID=670483 RepID=S7RFG9_GLOTA|nr:FMN-linked oxidoreductase [Gloeophyllum trabeum ATCC 11539]EPQ51259.1 FMN-linked oxidoreductase [Gloeophyllum trabeum ATCC 11539]